MGILYAILAAVFVGTSQVVLKRSFEDYPPSVAFFFDVFWGLVIWVPYSIIAGAKIDQLPLVFIYALLSGILAEAYTFYVMSKGEISITGTLLSTYPVYTIFFSVLINNETLPIHTWVIIAIAILGTLIISYPDQNQKGIGANKGNFIYWGLSAALAIGFSDALSKNIIDQTSSSTFLLCLAFVQIPISATYLSIEKQSVSKFLRDARSKIPLLGSMLNIVGVTFLFLAFENTFASIASPISATAPAFTVILAKIFLREKISTKGYVGILIIIFSIVALSAV